MLVKGQEKRPMLEYLIMVKFAIYHDINGEKKREVLLLLKNLFILIGIYLV